MEGKVVRAWLRGRTRRLFKAPPRPPSALVRTLLFYFFPYSTCFSILKTEAEDSYETLLAIYQITRQQIPKDSKPSLRKQDLTFVTVLYWHNFIVFVNYSLPFSNKTTFRRLDSVSVFRWKPTQLNPIDRDSPYLRTLAPAQVNLCKPTTTSIISESWDKHDKH
jgi:hypothetical protein